MNDDAKIYVIVFAEQTRDYNSIELFVVKDESKIKKVISDLQARVNMDEYSLVEDEIHSKRYVDKHVENSILIYSEELGIGE